MSSTSLYGEAVRLKLHYLLGSHTSCGLEVYEPAALGSKKYGIPIKINEYISYLFLKIVFAAPLFMPACPYSPVIRVISIYKQ